jgi:hypothetical protein
MIIVLSAGIIASSPVKVGRETFVALVERLDRVHVVSLMAVGWLLSWFRLVGWTTRPERRPE